MPNAASSRAINRSIAGASVTGASQTLFPEPTLDGGQLGGFNSVVERVVSNPSATATIWVNPTGGVAAANTEGSFPLAPLATFVLGGIVNAVNVLGVAGQPITAWER